MENMEISCQALSTVGFPRKTYHARYLKRNGSMKKNLLNNS